MTAMGCAKDAPHRTRARRRFDLVAAAAMLVFLLLDLATPAPVAGQGLLPALVGSPGEAAATPPAAEAAAPTEPQPIPLPDLAAESESLQTWLRQAQSRLAPDPAVVEIEQRAPSAQTLLRERSEESRARLAANPTLGVLSDLESEWEGRDQRLAEARKILSLRTSGLDTLLAETQRREKIWRATLEAARKSGLPSDVEAAIEANAAALSKLARQVGERRGELLSLVNRVSQAGALTQEILEELHSAQDLARSRLLQRDGAPIWASAPELSEVPELPERIGTSFVQDVATLVDYAREQTQPLVGSALAFVATLLLALALRGHLRRRLAAGEEPRGPVVVFERPISIALLGGIVVASTLMSNAPSLASRAIGLIVLAPVVRLLMPLSERPTQPLLLALAGFYLLDRVREVVDHVAIAERAILLLEVVLAALVIVRVLRSRRWRKLIEAARFGRLAERSLRVLLALFVLSALANLAGYVSFARLLAEGTLNSVFLGVVIFATDRVATAALLMALSTGWARRLGVVRAAAPEIVRVGQRVLRLVLALVAVNGVLGAFLVRREVLNGLSAIVFTPVEIGAASIALGDLLAFGFTLLAASWLSRFVRFALQEDVFPRVRLRRGVPNAVSSTASYAILLGGFFLAISAAGIDFSRFTVLAGAFGVGIGFGLQNVVNNFVSGLILLYERPVQVGDLVQIDDLLGDITRIGIRSSTLRTVQGAEVILPNGSLISDRLINWTLSDPNRRLDIPVGVAYGSDHARVLEVLRQAVVGVPNVLADPSPLVLFRGFGDSSLNFELRCWTTSNRWFVVQSDVTGAIYAALAEAGIQIPFPQRDLHLKSLTPEVASAIEGGGRREGPGSGEV